MDGATDEIGYRGRVVLRRQSRDRNTGDFRGGSGRAFHRTLSAPARQLIPGAQLLGQEPAVTMAGRRFAKVAEN